MQKNRFLTVTKMWVRREIKGVEFPKIMLFGKWLKDAGFSEGEKIVVFISDDCLTIRKCKKDEQPTAL